jgi:DNA-binding NtrC family response regulator
MKILVADDEKLKRVTLAHDLATQGHVVVTAADGAEALHRIETTAFDVVITDLRMPKVDGMDLLKRIRENPAVSTKVIVMTAYGSISTAVEAGKLGACDFLSKPFRNAEIFPLLARIESARRTEPPVQTIPAGSDAVRKETVPFSFDHAVHGARHWDSPRVNDSPDHDCRQG